MKVLTKIALSQFSFLVSTDRLISQTISGTQMGKEKKIEEHQACIDYFMLYIILFQSANSPAPAVNACILVHWSVTNRTTVGTIVMKKIVSW